MKNTFRLRIVLDHETDVFRDIEVDGLNTFTDLHSMVQEAFGFDGSQMASFYISNEDWEKGQEITLMNMGEKSETGDPILLMDDTTISDIVFGKGQKLLYVSDFLLMWCFYVDVIELEETQDNVILPRIVQSFGEAPDQYSKSPEMIIDTSDAAAQSLEDEKNEIEDMFDVFGMTEEFKEDTDY